MANRLLHSRGCHVWGIVLILATVPGLAHAAKKYTQVSTAGVKTYVPTDQYWFKELNRVFSSGELTTTSTVSTGGKSLSVPAVVKPAAAAGKAIMKLARVAGPISIGAELLSFFLEHTPDLAEVHDGQFVKDVTQVDPDSYAPEGSRYWRTDRNAKLATDATQACVADFGPERYSNGNPYPTTASCDFNGNCETATSASCGFVKQGSFSVSGMGTNFLVKPKTSLCTAPLVLNYASGLCESMPEPEVIDLSPEDWDVIEELEPRPLTDSEATAMNDNHPQGVPIDAPTHPTLPQTQPLAEPYQDPSTGDWWQDTAKLYPAPYPSIGVETGTTPVNGPLGIDDPAPYVGPETEQPLDTNDPTRVTIDGETTINVEICAEGDTRLICTELGTPPEGEIPEDTFDLTWDHAPVVFSEGACPVGPTAATPWGNVTIDMYWPCEFAKAIKSIILACAMFAAAYIFIGGLRTS